MIKRSFLVGLSAVMMSFMLVAPCNMVTYASDSSAVEIEDMNSEDYSTMPYSDIIKYRYKIVDGTKLYRRLYNYTEQCWIGDWEFVGEGFIEPDV